MRQEEGESLRNLNSREFFSVYASKLVKKKITLEDYQIAYNIWRLHQIGEKVNYSLIK
jgi:hypothetical protein